MTSEQSSHDPAVGQPRPRGMLRSGVRNALPRMFHSLRHRNYRLFFFGHMISMVGAWIQNPAMDWLIKDMTGSTFLLGAIGAVQSIPITLLSTLGGLAAERFDRRRILLVTQPLLMIAPLTVATIMFVNYKMLAPWHLMAVAVCTGTIMAFDIPTRQAFVVQLVGRADLPNAIALNSSIFNISRTIGPAIGGALMALASAAACFAANGLTYLSLIVALILIRLPRMTEQQMRHARSSRHPLGGFAYIWSNKALRAAVLLLASNSLFGWPLVKMLAAFAKDVYHRQALTFSGFMSVYGAGAFTGALLLAYFGRSRNQRGMIVFGVGTFILAVLAFTFTEDYLLAMAPLYVAGFGMMIAGAGLNSYVQMIVSDRFRGRVMGVYAMFFAGMMPFGFLITGFLGEHWSLVGIIRINIAILTCMTAGVALYWRRLARQEAAAAARRSEASWQ